MAVQDAGPAPCAPHGRSRQRPLPASGARGQRTSRVAGTSAGVSRCQDRDPFAVLHREVYVKFEILRSNAAQPYRWRIVASNGQVLATSENYASKQSARSACESVQKSAGSAEIVDPT
jgi:uncharacterized protein YegP (UPF0339 family)